MKKRFSIYILGLLTAGIGVAAPLSPEQALKRANSSSGARKVMPNKLSGAKPVYVAESESGVKGAYVFNNPDGGFVIVSADDLGYPVLGYSYEGSLDVNNLPPQLKSWLREYSDQIEYASDEGMDAAYTSYKRTTRADRKSIAPMLKTKWDQDAPYYDDCPTISGRRTYTGCVATSMAQVMNYFKYPAAGEGRVTVNVNGINSSMTLGDHPFDWDNMLDNYVSGQYTETQGAAVANLMKACGYSVNMAYGTTASGAQSQKISVALRRYFGYDPSLTYESRLPYSSSEWEEKVYASLAGGSPIIYGGQDPNDGGHSFVCDGYDKDGYFHFNWGWSGIADGYFLLNALNPEALGTGGGTGGGFNFAQDGIFNIKKPAGGTSETGLALLTAAGGLTADDVLGNRIYVGLQGFYNLSWRNETDTQLNLALGGVFTREGSDEIVAVGAATLAGRSTVTLDAGTYYRYEATNGTKLNANVSVPTTLPDGTYKMTLSCRDADHPTWPYYPVVTPYGYPDYVMVTKSGSTITATTVPIPEISLKSASLDGPLFYRRNVNVKATLSNPSSYELTCAPMLVLKNAAGNEQFISSSILITLQPGETVEKEWVASLFAVNGAPAVSSPTEFKMSIFNEYTGETMGEYGSVTMDVNPGNPTVKVNKSGIDGCSTEPVNIGGVDYNIYVVPDPSSFTLSMTMTVTKGYFDSNIYIGINRVREDAVSPTQTVSVVDQIFSQQYRLSAGEQIDLTVPVSFPEAEPGVIYVLDPRYFTGNSGKSLGQVRFMTHSDSGVGEIESDLEGEKEYYTLQGVRIVEPRPGEFVIEKSGDKVIKKIMK